MVGNVSTFKFQISNFKFQTIDDPNFKMKSISYQTNINAYIGFLKTKDVRNFFFENLKVYRWNFNIWITTRLRRRWVNSSVAVSLWNRRPPYIHPSSHRQGRSLLAASLSAHPSLCRSEYIHGVIYIAYIHTYSIHTKYIHTYTYWTSTY